MGTKDCVFLHMYEELYRLHYDRDAWYYNGGELPQYAILDKYPGVAFLADEGVQQGIAVICHSGNFYHLIKHTNQHILCICIFSNSFCNLLGDEDGFCRF